MFLTIRPTTLPIKQDFSYNEIHMKFHILEPSKKIVVCVSKKSKSP